MSESLETIVLENKAQEQQVPARNGKINNPITETRQEILNLKLSEELDDTQHSKNNTSLLNKRYSEVTHFFFSKFWFYFILVVLFVLFMASDKDIVMFFDFTKPQCAAFIVTLANKLLFVFGVVFLALLSFPTAKGLRRLFKSIIEAIAKSGRKP